MKKLLVFQHSESEGLGVFEGEIRQQGFEYDLLVVPTATDFPTGREIENYGALISLGGDASVSDIDRGRSDLKKELLLIQEALRIKMPILGICLGAQLLARAAGAKVYPSPVKEYGWCPIRFDDWFSKRNPLTFQMDLTKPHPVFQWHEEAFDIPVDGYRLAWNEACPNQILVYQGNAIGIQFHPEVTEGMITDWVRSDRDKVIRAGYDPIRIMEEVARHLPESKKMGHRFFYGFVSLVRENVRLPT